MWVVSDLGESLLFGVGTLKGHSLEVGGELVVDRPSQGLLLHLEYH